MTEPIRHDVIIIGAGAAGLYMLHTCRGLGLDAIVLERGQGIGGTWYWNRYPGARCDVESLDYSFSFDEELQREWRWSEKYATQPEILSYLEHVADRFDLRKDITLEAEVVSADFDDATGTWEVVTANGQRRTATFVIAASGVLSQPKAQAFPGQEIFAGDILVSSQWPEQYDFTGKRVAVIGVGSTGIQMTPIIAETAEQVLVFQRTPSYSIPAFNRALTDAEFEEAVRTYPERRKAARQSLLGVDTGNPNVATCAVPAEEVAAAYRRNYDYGGPMKLLTTFNDVIIDQDANDVVADFLTERIRERVGDEDLAATVTPDYPVGSRRLCVDTGYYETLGRDHVELVDLRQAPIDTFTATGIQTTDADYAVDVIVLATGFDAITGALSKIDPHGREGLSLARKWAQYPASYLGVMVAGFPNLFTVTGPLSPCNSNVFVAIEQSVEYIGRILAHGSTLEQPIIEATADAEERWVKHAAEVAAQTVYPLTKSWYTGANIEGKAPVVLPYLGPIGGYQQVIDDVAAAGFAGFAIEDRAASLAVA